jgi:DNA mismatch repair protein MutS2
MIEKTLRVLEYDKVKNILARFTATDPGREMALALRPLKHSEDVAESLAEISEMVPLLAECGRPPVGGCRDLQEVLRNLRAEGTWLLPDALLEVLSSIEAALDCRRYFTGREQAPLLAERASALADLKGLGQSIRKSIGSRGEILDSASFELGEIRRDIRQLRGKIKKVLEGLLASDRLSSVFQDRIITERNGRYVVPVRADHRGQIKGFIHDESASGQTLFVEPAGVLERNNDLKAFLRAEKREEERILRRLSEAVRQEAELLLTNQQILALIDFRAAAASFSRLSGSVAPRLAQQPLIELKEASHPLLLFHPDGSRLERRAVPVDLLLDEGHDTLVVSGPNTGGKTVALKTVGLLLFMARSGLHIPCHPQSRIYLFHKVFADIGDEQSIEENLSTFSGRLIRIKRILEEADEDSLVLLDEIGAGTDPSEGGALAMAVLDSLRARGARAVVTTHLNLIKGYAYLQESVVNAAVEFDGKTLAPTYRLHYGIPGASNAFSIARSLGTPDHVLVQAGNYLSKGEREEQELMEKLDRLFKAREEALVEAVALRESAQKKRDKRKQLLDDLEEQKQVILEKATRSGEQLVREAKRKIRGLFKEASEAVPDAKKRARLAGELAKVQKSFSQLRSEPRRKGRAPCEVKTGEILRVTALATEGEVVRVLDGEAELSIRGKKLRLSLHELEQFSPRRFVKKRTGKGIVRSTVERSAFSPRLLLLGRRVDESLLLLDRFLDDALLHGLSEVEVVHGAGEGILRRAVRDFLEGHREVAAFHAADVARGGDNVTIVGLKG